MRRVGWVALVALVSVVPAACGSDAGDEAPANALADEAITVASFDFAESELLGELYSQALEHGGYQVRRAFGIGPREVVSPALAGGLVELVPEYAGTALRFMSLGVNAPSSDVDGTHAALVSTLQQRPIVALAAAPGQNANAFVVTKETAERDGLRTLSDVRKVASQLTFGGPPECPIRPLCLGGLEKVYDLSFAEVLTLDVAGPRTREALQDGDVDMALLFSTDPAIGTGDLVQLEDDRGLQPAENVTPLVRTEVVERWGQPVVDIIDQVSARLTTSALRQLNARVIGQAPPTVAAAWLHEQGLA